MPLTHHFDNLPAMSEDEAQKLIVDIMNAYGLRGATLSVNDVQRMAATHLDREPTADELGEILITNEWDHLSMYLAEVAYDRMTNIIFELLD